MNLKTEEVGDVSVAEALVREGEGGKSEREVRNAEVVVSSVVDQCHLPVHRSEILLRLQRTEETRQRVRQRMFSRIEERQKERQRVCIVICLRATSY